MLKRLGLGLLKGLVLGGALGAGLQLGLGWVPAAGLAGYLLSMAIGATAGVLTGRPPWKHEAWIEAILKAVGGLGLGALLYWLAGYVDFALPFPIGDAPADTPWRAMPLIYGPAIAAIYGTLIELDNTDDDPADAKKSKAKKGPAVRVAGDDPLEEALAASEAKGKRRKRA